jgi:hypothetical protein
MKPSSGIRQLLRRGGTHRPINVEPFGLIERGIIEIAMLKALRVIKSDRRRLNLRSADEVSLNNELVRTLNLILENEMIPGFSKAVFQTIVRGGELPNNDGTLRENRPDLTFRSTRSLAGFTDPEHHGLFVECKIVDHSHPVSRYCENGLLKFVNRAYGWAVPSAMMLAYTRSGHEPMTHLAPYLWKKKERYRLLGKLARREQSKRKSTFCVSRHYRAKAAGDVISIHHFWFRIA